MKKTLIALALYTLTVPALAGSALFSPPGLTMPASQQIGSITVTNTSSEPVTFQARGFTWTQVNGSDVLTPTDDVKFGPAVFSIAPGGKQKMRVIRAKPVQGQEAAYRVIVSELPREQAKKEHKGDGVSLEMPIFLQYSLPIFYRSTGAEPHLSGSWSAKGLTVTNTGSATAKVIVKSDQWKYVLPQASVTFEGLKGSGAVQATVNGEATTIPAH